MSEAVAPPSSARTRSASPALVASAYDAIAPGYDRLTAEDRWMREVLWRRYARVFAPGDHVLDVGCGTGIDARFLLGRGCRVTALDISAGMLERLRAAAGDAIEAGRLRVVRGDGGDLSPWRGAGLAGIVSAFAGLNTVDDVDAFGHGAFAALRPGGRLIVHVLAPAGVWERWRAAREQGWRPGWGLGGRRQRAVDIAAYDVPHQLLDEAGWRAGLSRGGLVVRRRHGLGFLWPRHVGGRLPPLVGAVGGRVEAVLGRWWPFRSWGRFWCFELERPEPAR